MCYWVRTLIRWRVINFNSVGFLRNELLSDGEFKEIHYGWQYIYWLPVPVVVQSKAQVWILLITGNASSNPANNMEVYVLSLLCVEQLPTSAKSWSFVQRRDTVCVCVFVWVCVCGCVCGCVCEWCVCVSHTLYVLQCGCKQKYLQIPKPLLL